MPRALDAERAVLGAALIDDGALDAAAAIVTAADFGTEGHRRTFAAMLACRAAGEPIDLLTVAARLNLTDDMQAVPWLSRLIDGVPRLTNVVWYARRVREASLRRSVIRTCQVAARGASEDADLETVLDEMTDAAMQALATWRTLHGKRAGAA